jgi:hypothetical protein
VKLADLNPALVQLEKACTIFFLCCGHFTAINRTFAVSVWNKTGFINGTRVRDNIEPEANEQQAMAWRSSNLIVVEREV